MPITTVTWLMILSLIGTDILIRLLDRKRMNQPKRRLETDRRQFSYARHIPERRSGHGTLTPDRRLERDRRRFSYADHIPERRRVPDRRLHRN